MIYEYNDYKKLLKSVVYNRKEQVGKSFTFQAMAQACGIQKTYLSRVLNGKGHLNTDQLYRACRYLSFNEDETEFVNLLHEFSLSTVPERKQKLEKKIIAVRTRQQQSGKQLDVEEIQTSNLDISSYYLDPSAQLVHMFLLLERYRKNLQLIMKELNIDGEHLTKILNLLERLQIIRQQNNQYTVIKDNLHLSSDSILYRPYRYLLRMKGMDRTQNLSDQSSFNFSVIFTADDQTKKKIQEHFLEFLKWTQQAVNKAPQKEVYQMSFDLLSWTNR